MSYPNKVQISGDLYTTETEPPTLLDLPDYLEKTSENTWASGNWSLSTSEGFHDLNYTSPGSNAEWRRISEDMFGAYEPLLTATGTATVEAYNETNGDTIMIEIPVANSVNLINSGLGSTVNFGAMRRKNVGMSNEAWEVFDFNADEWGDQSGENAVTTENSLSGAGGSAGDFAVQANMRVFLLGIPKKVHETDCILIVVSGTDVLMGLEKPKLSRYPLNPGLVPYAGDGKIAVFQK